MGSTLIAIPGRHFDCIKRHILHSVTIKVSLSGVGKEYVETGDQERDLPVRIEG